MPLSHAPNILLIMSDQHRFDCLGVNGHPLLRTPNLDRLAAGGMNFRHAFTPIPLCIPARNSFFHGCWSFQHLAIANWDTEAPRPARPDLPTFIDGLRGRGYFLGHVGKWHVHPERQGFEYGFDEYVPETWYGRWRQAQGRPPPPERPYTVEDDGSRRFLNQWFGGLDNGISPEETRPAWGADHVSRMLEDRRRDNRPFFIQWWLTEPHLPCVLPEPFHSMIAPETVPPWPGFPDSLDNKPYIQRQQRRTWKLDGWTWEQWRPVVARYLGMISLIDAQVGRVIETLEQTGLAPDTWVIYTADHGDMCGSHGMIDKHYVMYDDVTRVPLIMRWPGVIPAGAVSDAFVSHMLDLSVTFLEVAGAERPESFVGNSLLPVMRQESRAGGRDDIFAAYHGNQFGLYTQRMVRDRRWKYVWNATAEDELYDLTRDPGELHNLAPCPESAAELARLRNRLLEWMEQADDPLLNRWVRAQLLEGLKA